MTFDIESLAKRPLQEILTAMQKHGSAVTLYWSEVDGGWGCAWVTGGERYTTVNFDGPKEAVLEMINMVVNE